MNRLCEAQTAVCIGGAVHRHHRRMRSQGGGNDAENLIDVCLPCHDWIHRHPAESYERGWLLRTVA